MKNIIFIFVLLSAIAVGLFVWTNPSRANSVLAEGSCNDHIVISQIYGGGGNSGSVYKNDFIELYNPTNQDISIENWSVQYVPATGNFPAISSGTTVKKTLLQGEIKAKSYFLVQENSASDTGRTLENPDVFGLINLAADKGKIALVSSAILVSSENDPLVESFVSYSGGSNTKSVYQKINSCPNTFFADVPNPRNSSVVENTKEESQSSDNTYIDESEASENEAQDPSNACATASADIKINEIFPYPESGNEFVEITNTGGSCVDISGWKMMDEAGHKKEFPENSIMGPGEYFFLEGNLYLNNDSDTVYLLIGDGDTKNDALDSRHFEKAQKDFSYSFDGKEWQWTSTPTPNEENIITDTDSAEGAGDSNSGKVFFPNEKIYLNEILPNPKGEEEKEEFIEILNGENGPIDLFGWTIRDGSKTGKYVFKEHTEIGPKEYLAIYRPQFKIALNNSEDSVSLYNPRGELASNVSFDKSIENASYGFDGKGWRWSKYLTPGKENKFDSEPSVKITKPKYAFKDLYTDFFAKAKDKETKKLKYIWDFGDGKKSYLAKTSHKYLDTGKYTVTLTVGDDSQTVEKSFVLAVKNYPQPDIEIVKIVPNPVGNDSDGEIVEIRNNSGKKIELQGWKIASGSDDKIYNHLINGEISLGPNETKTITREICKFSLNNKAGKVQLVSPDGKIIDEVEYTKEKISEGEAFAKIDGKWQWISPDASTNTNNSEKEIGSENTQNEESNLQSSGEILGATDENVPYHAPPQTGYTPEDEFIFFKFFGLLEYKQRELNFCPANQSIFQIAYLR